MCSALAPFVAGKIVRELRLARADLRWPIPVGLADIVQGKKLGEPRRRGKYILIPVIGVGHLLIHLGMSGSLRFYDNQPAFGKHDHVAMGLDDGRWWVFCDPRRFGHLDLIRDQGEDKHWLLRNMGPEPLGNQFSPAYLSAALSGRRSPIKTALLDQKLVAGIGNIYACEALYRARISPSRIARTITGVRAERLVPAIRSVLRAAILQGGTSLRDYVQPDGQIGYFVQSLCVYGRAGEACAVCGSAIKQIKQSGRSSFYCSSCQR